MLVQLLTALSVTALAMLFKRLLVNRRPGLTAQRNLIGSYRKPL